MTEVDLTCLPNGPYRLTGSFAVFAESGQPVATTETTYLCRCGQSASKPPCDGSHARTGFRTEGAEVSR